MIAILAAWVLAAAEPAAAQAAAADPAAPAAAPAAAAPATPTKVKSKRDEKVCWEEAPLGSLIPRKFCATRGELEDRKRQDQDWKMNFHPVQPAGN